MRHDVPTTVPSSLRFSVLTPTYQSLRFLPDALNSVLEQRGPVEHVVVDGASNDGTSDYLEQHDRADLVWLSEPDRGQSDALNKAIQLSSGEIIGWLNADEWYTPGAIECAREIFSRNSAIDVVFGDYYEVGEHGEFRRLVTSHPFSRYILRNYGCFVPSCATFIRRSALPPTPWNTEHRWIMDLDLWLGLDTSGAKFHHVRKGLAAFRVHDLQVTSGNVVEALPEWTSLFRKYRIASTGHLRRRYRSAQGVHRLLKVVDGGYLRELSAGRRYEGRSLPKPHDPT